MPEKFYKSRDGKSYPLWKNIDEVMDVAMPAYWSKLRENRRERNWIFRGQLSDEWDMTPSLYRPPNTREIIDKRQSYTKAFINDLVKDSEKIGLKNLNDDKLMAVAQHYGFYTPFLDFSRNLEVAAYFATKNSQKSRIGVIYGYNLKEYDEMRNPFAVWGISQDESEKEMKSHVMIPLPISKTIEFSDVPRIYMQEGLFVKMNIEEKDTFINNCIDRFYFYQQEGKEYTGQHESWKNLFPSIDMFDSETTYESFIEMARLQKPEVFQSTPEFCEEDLFPSIDPIAEYVEKWKLNNPYPFTTGCDINKIIPVRKNTKEEKSNESISSVTFVAEKAVREGMKLDMQGKWEDAIEQYNHAINLYNSIDDLKGKGMCFNKIGVIYCDHNNPNKSLKYLSEGLIIEETFGDDYNIATAMINIGGVLEQLNRFDESSNYYKKAQLFAVRLESNFGKEMILHAIREGLKRINS